LGDAPTWINAVVNTQVEANADVHHLILHQGRDNLHYVGNIHADVARDAAYHSYTYWLGGQLSRNDLTIALNGTGAATDLYGLYLCGDNDHLDNHTVVEHRVPHCRSNELYKGVLTDSSKAVFNGRIVVFKDAQKTDSQQANRNLLLSETATINTKPELEIYADDVSCAHGTTVGQMDEEALFYLRSRGVGLEHAKVMLTHAFCMELLETIPDPTLRERVQKCVDARLTELTRNRS
jgi:Fe-S cluster assembly protein SufD